MSVLHQDQSPLDLPLGEVLRLPCKLIKGQSSAPPVLIKHIANQLQNLQRNILPIVVRVLDEDSYEAVLNLQILDAARVANLDFVQCIAVNDQMLSGIKLEAGEAISVDISIATQEEILDALIFLKSKNPNLKKMDSQKAAQGILDHRTLREIRSLSFLTTLKCGIGKAKLPQLAEVLKYPEPSSSEKTTTTTTRRNNKKNKLKG
jgi:hypothetical protein